MLKTSTRTFVLLLALAMLAACEFPASFVIMNRSEEMVSVTYAFKNSPAVEFSCVSGNMFTSPSVESAEDIEEMEDRELAWIPLSAEDVVCDPLMRTVFVPLGPGVALKVVDHDDPGVEYGNRDLKVFPIDRLFINSPTGSVEYRGDRVLKAFERSATGMAFYLSYQ